MLRAARLRRSRDIADVRAHGRPVRRPCFTLRAVATGHVPSRITVSAPRTLGGAVKRNRARRRLREAFRRALPGRRPLDAVVSARAAALDAPFAALVLEAQSALEEAGR